jgi:hypothetical protein
MLRWIMGTFLTLASISSATASLNHKLPHSFDKDLPLKSARSLAAQADLDSFRIKAETEVLLDGRPATFEQIPSTATIILLETMTNESKEISRIHFRSGSAATKKP